MTQVMDDEDSDLYVRSLRRLKVDEAVIKAAKDAADEDNFVPGDGSDSARS